ncbi:ATP-binding protein [Actinoplanes sp. TBRC 11911]|uniref:AlbA family DNA-binding domain-containing protein n=1 Tax=Actinoplanes sp. TBRC 11911 TaxID=2729386 RepID=UPI00145E8681|nr:ATP-binding protein [Actinoplanes sp. TBRC 11911]NMO51441.1 ATP-binding protein [Actinoplanes sp. TBRC 11911]
MTSVDELTAMIEQRATVDVRLSLCHSTDGWQINYGEVLVGAEGAIRERTWRYSQDAFVERRLPGPLVAELVREKPQQLAGLTVTAPAAQDAGNFQRLAANVRYNNTTLPWPRTEWHLNPATQASTRPRSVLVGDGPSYLHAEAAFNAFFYAAATETGPRPPHMLWRIVRLDPRGRIHQVTIAPDTLTVLVQGDQLTGAMLELSSPEGQRLHPLGTSGQVQFDTPHGLTPGTLLMLRSDNDWMDFRYFPAPGSPDTGDRSVTWDLPGADVSVLIAGGETQYVEFKDQLPVHKHRRKMLKTVAAFASGEGGTVLIGVSDDGQITGVDATNLDELTLAVRGMIRSMIDPDPAVTVRAVPIDGKTVLVIEVRAGAGWYAYNREKPEFYLRRGASTMPARLAEIAGGFGQPAGPFR